MLRIIARDDISISFRFLPLIITEPLSGIMSPANTFIKVDFPEPLGPMILNISPPLISKDTSLKIEKLLIL